jgi:hypothetical protein
MSSRRTYILLLLLAAVASPATALEMAGEPYVLAPYEDQTFTYQLSPGLYSVVWSGNDHGEKYVTIWLDGRLIDRSEASIYGGFAVDVAAGSELRIELEGKGVHAVVSRSLFASPHADRVEAGQHAAWVFETRYLCIDAQNPVDVEVRGVSFLVEGSAVAARTFSGGPYRAPTMPFALFVQQATPGTIEVRGVDQPCEPAVEAPFPSLALFAIAIIAVGAFGRTVRRGPS